MKPRSWLHPAVPVALLLLVLPVLAQGAALRVAVFPAANASQEVGAARIIEDILRTELKKVEATRATFLYPADVERLLDNASQTDRIERLNDRFSNVAQLDSTAAAGLDTVLTVDAILLVKVGEWENHRVPVIGAGQSSATVGLSFALYDARTLKLLWTKSPREQRFSRELDASSANVNYDETGLIQRKADNAPPRYEIVAGDLVRDAFKKFPRG
ncbi:MAG: hypothetical protein ACM3PF_11635 [Bacteroidota bacterium]